MMSVASSPFHLRSFPSPPTEEAEPAAVQAGHDATRVQPPHGKLSPPWLAGAHKDRLGWPDVFCMAAGFLLTLTISLVLGHGRMLWEDEMLGWMLVTDPSWHHMVHAWKLGADGGGFAFYLSARAWLHLFGASGVAFRMYSAVCFGSAFMVLWVTTRRFYGRWITGFALFNTFFCSPPLVLHFDEGRFYGLLVLAAALALWLVVRVNEIPGPVPVPYVFGFFAVHALLITSHILGVVYSGFILLGMIVVDASAGRRRPILYASVALSWLLLLPALPAIRASAAVGKPWFWTTPPVLRQCVGVYAGFSGEIAVAIAGLGLLLLATRWGQGTGWIRAGFRSRRVLWILTGALFLVPVAFVVEALSGPSLFISRYLLPVSIGTAWITAELLALVDWDRLLGILHANTAGRGKWLRLGAAGVLAGVLVGWDFVHLPVFVLAQKDYGPRLSAVLPRGVPVLTEDAWMFTEVIGREHNSGVQYLYPLDWDQTTSRFAPRLEVTQYNLMNNWRKAGYFSDSIVDLPSFLRDHSRFLVLDGDLPPDLPVPPIIGNPLVLRFRMTPGYRVTLYHTIHRGGGTLSAWMVEHDPAKTGVPEKHGALDR